MFGFGWILGMRMAEFEVWIRVWIGTRLSSRSAPLKSSTQSCRPSQLPGLFACLLSLPPLAQIGRYSFEAGEVL